MSSESSVGFRKARGCLVASLISDAMGESAEGKDYRRLERERGWIDDFDSGGTDDTIMRNLLSEALIGAGVAKLRYRLGAGAEFRSVMGEKGARMQ